MVQIDSWRINIPSSDVLIDRILTDADEKRGGTVFTLNLDHLTKLRHDADFRAAYERATYVTADGMPVVMLARAEGVFVEPASAASVAACAATAAAATARAWAAASARTDDSVRLAPAEALEAILTESNAMVSSRPSPRAAASSRTWVNRSSQAVAWVLRNRAIVT